MKNLDANKVVYQAGEKLPHIFTSVFMDNFVFIGGGGATIGLVLALGYLAKKKKSITEFRPDGAVPFEIFDPLGNPAAHIESPRTDWILEHFHAQRPHTMPLGKYFAAASPQY